MKANKIVVATAVAVGGALVRQAVITAIEDAVAVEAKRLQVPYWLAIGAVGVAILAAAS